MANLRLPPNVRQDPNTGYYEITNRDGKTIRVNAATQEQLDTYVRSVNTNTPATVTQIDPTTGRERVDNFNPSAIVQQTDSLGAWRAAQTQLKRQAGVVGTTTGGFVDFETGQPLTRAQAEQRVRAAGLPPDTIAALEPLDRYQANQSQRDLDQTSNQPAQLAAPEQIYTPPQPEVVPRAQSFPLPDPDTIQSRDLPAEASVRSSPQDVVIVQEYGSDVAVDIDDGILGRTTRFEPLPVEPIDRDPALGTTTVFDDAGVTTNFEPRPVDATPGVTPAFDESGAVSGQTTLFAAPDVDPVSDPGSFPAFDEAGSEIGTTTLFSVDASTVAFAPGDVGLENLSDSELDAQLANTARDDPGYALLVAEYERRYGSSPNPLNVEIVGADQVAAEQAQAAAALAQQQATIAAQRNQASQGDWRVKLRLAAGATYLYKDPNIAQDGILYPLAVTDGVVFPYTPQITTAYNANYSPYDLTHSNYRGYFYQNSYVGEIQIQATFTAQDTFEANYLLAVIQFFRSVTKMFYGQDEQRGSPPPLVFLQGLGEFQFNLHPCAVTQFNYTLPADVDYIRARTATIDGTSLLIRRDRQTLPTNPFSAALDRLSNAGLNRGAINSPPAPPTLGTSSPTYVPTKLEATINLLPIQSREQQSRQFSVKSYANGDLVKGGFW